MGGVTVVKIDMDHLRELACRTRDALWEVMQSVLDHVTESDAVNSFQHCGYSLRMD